MPDWQIAELSRQADAIGRHERIPVLKPKVSADIDRRVAKEFGISVRTVRRYRSDRRLDPFRSVQPWEVRQWERGAAEQAQLRRRAAALLTPERFAKGDIYLFGSTLMARGAEPDIIPGAPAHRRRVGCEEFRIWLYRPSKELRDIPRVKFIPARKWVHFWPSAVAGWAGNSPTWTPDLGLGGDPRPLSIAPKRDAGALLSLGYRTKCATFAHTLPDTIVIGPHSTWRWMKVAKPLWAPAAVNYTEDRLIVLLDLMGEALEPMLGRLVLGVAKKPA